MLNKIKYFSRTVFFILAVYLIVDLNTKTEEDAQSIAQFKWELFKKLQPDSLDTKHKVDLVVNETTKFMDDSAHVKRGTNYLIKLLVLFCIVELGFLIMKRRNSTSQS